MTDLTFKNVVNGELVDSASGETYEVIDPSTGEVYARAPMSGAEDVDRAYAAAEAAFAAWGETTPQASRGRPASRPETLEQPRHPQPNQQQPLNVVNPRWPRQIRHGHGQNTTLAW